MIVRLFAVSLLVLQLVQGQYPDYFGRNCVSVDSSGVYCPGKVRKQSK